MSADSARFWRPHLPLPRPPASGRPLRPRHPVPLAGRHRSRGPRRGWNAPRRAAVRREETARPGAGPCRLAAHRRAPDLDGPAGLCPSACGYRRTIGSPWSIRGGICSVPRVQRQSRYDAAYVELAQRRGVPLATTRSRPVGSRDQGRCGCSGAATGPVSVPTARSSLSGGRVAVTVPPFDPLPNVVGRGNGPMALIPWSADAGTSPRGPLRVCRRSPDGKEP